MTTAGQAFLSAAELFCLAFAAIALVYYADRLRSGLLNDPNRQGRVSAKWKAFFRKDHAQTKR
jgi:hypothetical protein